MISILESIIKMNQVQLQMLEEFKILKNTIKKPSDNIHQVKCKNCNKDFMLGHRYKCLYCKDYDICEDCESLIDKNVGLFNPYFVHDQSHVFIKIRNSLSFVNKMKSNPKMFNDY